VHNPTRAEQRLWARLRRREPYWWREVRTDIWTLDFYCPHALLAVEVDGGYHRDTLERDHHRDRDNAAHGIMTLRFTNEQIFGERRNVLRAIDAAVRERTGVEPKRSRRTGRRADAMREHYVPDDDLRAPRVPEPRRPAVRTYAGSDPGRLLAEKVQNDRWASQPPEGENYRVRAQRRMS
jgi:very-short-patch-repair endonuclease